MRELIEELIYRNFREVLNSNVIKELENTMEMNKKKVKQNLNKKQKKLLLRIGDANDLITEECSCRSFIAGFKMGLKIGYETNKE